MGAPAVNESLSISAISVARAKSKRSAKTSTSNQAHPPEQPQGFGPPPPDGPRTFECPSIQGDDFVLGTQDSLWAKNTPHSHLSLHIWLDLWVGDTKFVINALIDTGAEINVIRKGLIPPELTHQNVRPITLTAADANPLTGGKMGVSGTAVLGGAEIDSESTRLEAIQQLSSGSSSDQNVLG